MTRKIQSTIFSMIVLLTISCKGLEPKFFILNHELQPVAIQYKYYEKGQFSDSVYFDYQPKLYVLKADTLLGKKLFKRFPTGNTRSYFDTLPCIQKDSLNYVFNIPAKSTVSIFPVYAYGDNIEHVILNGTDTIRFMYDYPKIENQYLKGGRLAISKQGLLGTGYFLINLKLKEIQNTWMH